MPTYEQLGFGQGASLSGDRARSVFGHVMGLVACAFAFCAAGAYIARNENTSGFLWIILEFACIFGLNWASRRGRDNLATTFLMGLGLFAGMFISPLIVYYAKSDPGVVYEAAGCTALGVAAIGSFGYSTRKDLSNVMRYAMYGWFALMIVLIVGLFVAIPGGNIIWGVLGIIVFGAFTAFDFQRLARNPSYQSAVPIAASIFLDVFNIFIFMLSLFGGGGSGRR